MRDRGLGTLRQQHPDRNLQSPPDWIHDVDRPISPLRSAKDPQGNTMKGVKGVEDLNICIIDAQGIVGVGATTRTFIALSPAAESPMTAAIGIRRASFSRPSHRLGQAAARQTQSHAGRQAPRPGRPRCCLGQALGRPHQPLGARSRRRAALSRTICIPRRHHQHARRRTALSKLRPRPAPLHPQAHPKICPRTMTHFSRCQTRLSLLCASLRRHRLPRPDRPNHLSFQLQ